MNTGELSEQIKKKGSYLCVGLDTDVNKIPHCIKSEADPVFSFNKAIIDATAIYSVAYKPNIAFYESLGIEGWKSLEKTVLYIRKKYPEIFLIADAKRGDIGNTSEMYAKTFFETFDFDAVTLSPYMGFDTVAPFLKYKNKWSILLALTSNPSANDFQYSEDKNGLRLFEKVMSVSKEWGENIMYVVGATRAEMLADVRKIVPDSFLLVPGIGAQGGSLEDVSKYGMNKHCGLIVNSSRAILYADSTPTFAETASREAEKVQKEMDAIIRLMDR
ncbi:MAG: orotidine-5'-phosphate decarboxylase [Prevotellaceae bacterium]|jgi:orotidine-5'-phosphate decarboxylase|nr:orotidine-5'-phosphate decarboxylase [Prevotellaceae bacterium]